MFHQHHIFVFALARLWNGRPTLTKLLAKLLGFLRRNLKACLPKLRETAYFSLVRSSLEYSSAVWDPFRQKDIDKLEKIQRAAARFVTPHWDKILFGIELSLIGILFRQLPWNRNLLQHSRVSWSTRSASLSPPLQPDTPQWRAIGVFTSKSKIS